MIQASKKYVVVGTGGITPKMGYLTVSDSVLLFHSLQDSSTTQVTNLYIPDTKVEQPDYKGKTTTIIIGEDSQSASQVAPVVNTVEAKAGYITISDSVVTVHNIDDGTTSTVDKIYIADTGVEQPEYQSAGGGYATGMDFYKCASVNTSDSTWSGYKAVITDGMITGYVTSVTSGLTYMGIIPLIGRIYTEDAKIEITNDIPRNPVFYLSLASQKNIAETGQSLDVRDNINFSTVDGVPCGYFNGNSKIFVQNILSPGVQSISFSFWAKAPSPSSNYVCQIYLGDTERTYYRCFGCFYYGSTGIDFSAAADELQDTNIITHSNWNNIILMHDALTNTSSVYINGTLALTKTRSVDLKTDLLSIGTTTASTDSFQGYISSVRIYNRTLSEMEISALASEFTPTNS